MTAPIFLVYSPREQIPLIRSIFDPTAGIANIMLNARDEETFTSKLGICRIVRFAQFRATLHASHVYPSNPQSRRSLNAPCRQDSTTIRLHRLALRHHPRRTLRTIPPLRRTPDRYRQMCLASSQADPISENRFGRERAMSLLPYRLEDSRDCEATCGPARNSGIFHSEPTTARRRDHKTASSKRIPRRLHKQYSIMLYLIAIPCIINRKLHIEISIALCDINKNVRLYYSTVKRSLKASIKAPRISSIQSKGERLLLRAGSWLRRRRCRCRRGRAGSRRPRGREARPGRP